MECPEQRTPPEVLLSLHLLPLLRSFRFVPFSQNWFRFNTRRGNKSGPLSGLIRDNPEFVASACAVGQWDRFGVCDNKLVCNRYRLTHSKQHLAERFGALDEIEDRPRYNIAPTQSLVTVRREMGQKIHKFTTVRRGLIPSWAKDTSIGTRTLNARSETVTTTPAYDRAYRPRENWTSGRKWDQ